MSRRPWEPYTTDSESDTDSESSYESDATEGFQLPDYSAFAQGLAASPAYDPSGQLIVTDSAGQPIGYSLTSGYQTYQNLQVPPDPSGNLLKTSQTTATSILMVDSRNRDRTVYSQPTDLTVKLPRVYKNIVNFQVIQMKLLSAFYYFRRSKENIDISILERDRTITSNGQTIPNVIQNTIRQGTYDINSLLAELTLQLNKTPLFYDYINGFADFATKFAPTGDFALNFNQPGDTYYDSLLDAFIPNPTMDFIVSKYFVSRYAGFTSYSASQIKIAYYYPVLKEALLDQAYPAGFINLTLSPAAQAALLPGETARSRVIYTFQGLNDPVILELVTNNITNLDAYRLAHTFRASLVNKYVVTYETFSNHVVISTPSLNTSLVTLLNQLQAQYFAEQLALNGLTPAQYNAINIQNSLLLAVLVDMSAYYQRWLAAVFGIEFNTFDLAYLITSNFPLPLRDGLEASGISSNFTPQVLASPLPPQTRTLLEPFQQDAPQFWNRIQGLSTPTIAHLSPALTVEYGGNAVPLGTWNQDTNFQDTDHPLVGSNVADPGNPNTTEIGTLYTNKRTGFAEFLTPLSNSQYTVFRFKSPVRQTLQIATLPRPTEFRYPAYNAVTYDASRVALFDASYAFVAAPLADVSGLTLLPIPGFSTPAATANFGSTFQETKALWGTASDTMSVLNSRLYYQFWTPTPPTAPAAPAYKYPLTLTVAHANESQTFQAPLQVFLYQDRAAFMADISANRAERDIHYKAVFSTTTDVSAVSFTFNAYANTPYYILARSQSTSFATEQIRIVPSFPSSTQYLALTSSLAGFDPLADPAANLGNFNYAQNADPDFLKLPVQSTLWSTPATDPTLLPLTFSTALMGYDTAGVSTDFTNYVGFVPSDPLSNTVPTAPIRIDPTTGYLAQVVSPYNTSTSTYLSPGSGNAILTSNAAGVYTPSTITARQQSLVHWYGNLFVPPTENQLLYPTESIVQVGATGAPAPFTATTPLGPLAGYSYRDRLDTSGNPYLGQTQFLDLGDGIFGIGFVPEQGVWSMDRFMFKSIFTDASGDPNRAITHIGVFPAAATSNRAVQTLSLSSALVVLSSSATVAYDASNTNFGYDVVGGTFYEFLTTSSQSLTGFTQSAYEYTFDINAFYIAVPFTAAGTPTYYFGLAGSQIPYPFYNLTFISSAVATPQGPYSPPTGTEFFVPGGPFGGADPVYGPPAGTTNSQSRYEQSMAMGTTLLTFANPYPITAVSTPFDIWTPPFPTPPTELTTDCSGYLLVKDTMFRVFSYQTNVSTQTFTPTYTFTMDEVFPTAEQTSYLGTAANETEIAFFGLSNATPSSFLIIKTLNPATGTLQFKSSEPSPAGFQSSVQLFRATYNNYGGYVMACQSWDAGSATTDIQVVAKATSSGALTTFQRQTSQPDIDYFEIGQSPKEGAGRFWVFPHRTGVPGPIATGTRDIAYVNPNAALAAPPAGDYVAAITSTTATYADITQYALSNAGPSTFRSPIVTRDVAKDRVFLLSEDAPTKFYEASFTVGVGTPTVVSSLYDFPSTPTALYAGAAGAKWSLIYDTLYGNRNDAVDAPKAAGYAWQLLYPVHRIVFRQTAKNFSYMKDLSTLQYPEYPHTALILYDGSGAITADTSGRWGLESSGNFLAADFSFSGWYFNGYDYAVPLQDNRATGDYYYLTVRNYTPTETSQVLLRVAAPNKYTFGYATPMDISGEISTAKYVSTTQDPTRTFYWDPNYVQSLLRFDSNFIFSTKTFGANVIPGFAGSNLSSVTGFGDFYGRLTSIYAIYSTQSQVISSINTGVKQAMSNFILNDMSNILPASSLSRQRYTDPLQFSILWKSALTPVYDALTEEWGLGWNLGYAKRDTPYDTVQRAQSFFKIIDDYINLRLNPEFDMNRVDTTAQENYSETLDSTGFTKAYYGKLLLANFGNYAQTMISNPLSFTPPFGKLDRLTFQWVNNTGTVIDNSDCEWNAVVQIVEQVDIVTTAQPPLLAPK